MVQADLHIYLGRIGVMAVVPVDGAHPADLQEALGEQASTWKSVRYMKRFNNLFCSPKT